MVRPSELTYSGWSKLSRTLGRRNNTRPLNPSDPSAIIIPKRRTVEGHPICLGFAMQGGMLTYRELGCRWESRQ